MKKKRMGSLEVLSREDGGLTVHSSRISYFLFAGTKPLTETMYAEEGLVWPPGFRGLVHDHLAPCTWAQHHGGGNVGWRRGFMADGDQRSRKEGTRLKYLGPSLCNPSLLLGPTS